MNAAYERGLYGEDERALEERKKRAELEKAALRKILECPGATLFFAKILRLTCLGAPCYEGESRDLRNFGLGLLREIGEARPDLARELLAEIYGVGE